MSLYGFSRKDIAQQLSEFAKKDLIANYPTKPASAPGLSEFKDGAQTARDPELYMFRADDGIPAAEEVPAAGDDVKIECTKALCKIYKPRMRSQSDWADNDKDVDVNRVKTFADGTQESGSTQYGTATYWVYNTHTDAIPANTMSLCALVGGVLFAFPPQKTQKRIRFRLKTSFNDQGYASAYVLDQWGCNDLTLNTPVNVCDPRKLFAHAIGADTLTSIHNANPNNTDFLHAGGSVGYAVMTYDIDPPEECDNCLTPESDCEPANCYPRWEVEQCTQIANKMKVQIDALNGTGKITGELIDGNDEGSKQLKFNPSNAFISHWPYVDYPPEITVPSEGSDYKINVRNPHMFTALDGWAIIERVEYSSRLQNAANRCVPYSQGVTDQVEWHIVDVEKPIARWVCASFSPSGSSGHSWLYVSSQEGYDPNSPNYFAPEGSTVNEHILTHECLEIDCLENGQKGVGYWDSNGQNYQIISTNSSLYGEAKEIEAIARKVSDPPSATPLLNYNDCDLEYEQMSPFKVFGANPQCPETQTPVVISPTLQPVEVVSGVDRAYTCTIDGTVDPTIQSESECNNAGGTWALSDQLCFTYNTVYVCQTTPVAEPECIDVCCDDPPDPPPPSECIDCTQCPEESIDFTSFALSWSAVQSGNPGGPFDGNHVEGTATWTQNGDCCATLSVTLHSDDPLIPDAAVTATVCIQPAGVCINSAWEITLAWSQPTFAGVTLPTTMCGGQNTTCAGDYGYNASSVIPTTPDNGAGGSWGEADISITACTP